MPLLDIRHLSKAYPVEAGVLRQSAAPVRALSDVSFQIQKSETLALVGGSGCGKSTLARIIAGLLAPDTGELLWEGKPLQNDNRRERARRIQMIFQDPYASLNPKLSIGTQLREVVKCSSPLVGEDAGGGAKKADIPPSRPSPTRGEGGQERCIDLLESVGLSADALSHYPFQFSGGQRQRIAIARALALDPALLVADEPLSALDSTTQAQILALLRGLKASRGLALLFITHDLAVLEDFADRVIVLEGGKIVEEGTVSQVLQSPAHAYTRALLDAVPRAAC